jgi:CRP/FNR family cyclic AMP-dependent transcriptional regulator
VSTAARRARCQEAESKRRAEATALSSQQAKLDSQQHRLFDVADFLENNAIAHQSAEFRKNQLVFREGDHANHVCYLEDGYVRVSALSHSGRRATFGIVAPGEFFGLDCLTRNGHRTSTASAMCQTSVRIITKEDMTRCVQSDASFSAYCTFSLLRANIQMEQALLNLLCNSSEHRLIWVLLFLSRLGTIRDANEVTIPKISQSLLGEMIGATRTHVNSFMTKLKRLGLIEYDGLLTIRRAQLAAYLKSSSR